MYSPFQLNKPVGSAYSHDFDDVAKTKKALSDLGHFETPKYGATRFPDTPLFDAIKSFQKSRGLAVDGVMKPDGPTVSELSRVLAERSPRRRPIFDTARNPIASPLMDSAGAPLPPRSGAEPKPKPPKVRDQVALGPAAAMLPLVLGAAARAALQRALQATVGGVATAATGSLKGDALETPLGDQTKTPPLAKRTDIATPPPPTPPSEPQDGPGPTKTEFPAKPPFKPIDLSRPFPVESEPTIYVHPMPSKEMTGGMVLDRNEREDTKAQIDRIRDEVIEEKPDLDHIGGGRDPETGEDIKEFRTPGPGYAFPLPGRKTGDGRRGSGYTDLTFATKDRKVFWHFQTVDVDRNGKPIVRELDNAERIRRALQGIPGETHHIILVPKHGPIWIRH